MKFLKFTKQKAFITSIVFIVVFVAVYFTPLHWWIPYNYQLLNMYNVPGMSGINPYYVNAEAFILIIALLIAAYILTCFITRFYIKPKK